MSLHPSQEPGHGGHAAHDLAHTHDHGGPALYRNILIALVILTCITVFVARHPFDNNALNVTVALAIATLKATLVALFFMHLKGDSPVNSIILVSGFVFLGIFFGSVLTDFTSRENVLPASYGVPGNAPGGVAGATANGAVIPQSTPGAPISNGAQPVTNTESIKPSSAAAPSTGEHLAAPEKNGPIPTAVPGGDNLSGISSKR